MRIYELAKDLDMKSRDLLDKLRELGFDYTSHMASINGEELDLVLDYFTSEDEEEEIAEEAEQETEAKKENTESHKPSENKKRNKKKKNRKSAKNKNNKNAENNSKAKEEKTENNNIVEIPSQLTVLEFSELIEKPVNQIIMKLIELGVMANQNENIDYDTAEILASEFGIDIKPAKDESSDEEETSLEDILDYEDKEEDLKPRPPVVTVMGHVDHGKTSLLDSIRASDITRGEAGGITQHIGASTVRVDDKTIVFLDTPGHEAFTAMRSRGASITDITILVVAADDGVMPQTEEAISHAKAAGVPIIVAINKMDKPEANINRVYQELAEHGLTPEEWGGDTVTVPVSAKTGQGVDELLEMVLMIAELSELKANPDRRAVATVIEANLDVGRGPVANVLVQKGTLNTGDIILSGIASGRVRAMFDDKGNPIDSVGPSMPAQILGLSDVPESGDQLYEVEDEKTAREYADKVKEHIKEEKLKASEKISLDALYENIQEGEVQNLNLIVKTDVKGTVDAVVNSLAKLSNDEVKVNFIHSSVGGITESDVLLAETSNAVIIGFNVRPNAVAAENAKRSNVDIRTYRVIYDAIEDIKNAVNGMLEPVYEEEVIGMAEVRDVFRVPNVGNVAGIYVQSGKVTRNSSVRLLRNDIIITEADISSLKRFKDDVREVNQGYEAGLGLENYDDIKVGDRMEFFEMKEVER